MHAQPTILCLKTLKPRYARNDNSDELRQVLDENIGHGDVTDGSLYVGVQIFVLYSPRRRDFCTRFVFES
jgi:hypothetical protein